MNINASLGPSAAPFPASPQPTPVTSSAHTSDISLSLNSIGDKSQSGLQISQRVRELIAVLLDNTGAYTSNEKMRAFKGLGDARSLTSPNSNADGTEPDALLEPSNTDPESTPSDSEAAYAPGLILSVRI